jgi:hypothetical protein
MQDFLKTDALFFLNEYDKISNRDLITFFPEAEVKVIHSTPLRICDGEYFCRAKLDALKDSIVIMPGFFFFLFVLKFFQNLFFFKKKKRV